MGRRAVVLGFALAAASCAAAPPGPRGPLRGPGVEIAMDYSYAYGSGEGTLADGTTTNGSADYYWSQLAIVPRRLEARISPVDWVDVGGQIGWLGGGADVRVGLPARPGSSLALQLVGGFESGEAGPFKETKPTGSKWLRLEAYPLVPLPGKQTRLVLAAGVDVGRFHHELPDPRPDLSPSSSWGPNHAQTIRRETRLETSVGLFVPARFASAVITLSPYFVLDAGSPDTSCEGCTLVGYRQDWGIVLVTRLALRRGF